MTRTRQTLALAAVFALALSGSVSLRSARAGGGTTPANAASKCNLVVQGQHFRLPCRG